MYFLPRNKRESAIGESSPSERLKELELGEYFHAIATTPMEKCGSAFAGLEKNGIYLDRGGHGGFMTALFSTPEVFDPARPEHRELLAAIEERLEGEVRFHMFSAKGKLFILLCFPVIGLVEAAGAAIVEPIRKAMHDIMNDPRSLNAEASLIVSWLHNGKRHIYHSVEEVENRCGFHDFLDNPPRLHFMEFNLDNFLGDFNQCLLSYRLLANKLATDIRLGGFSSESAAEEVRKCVVQACAGNSVPVQTHIHMLMLALSNTMVDRGIVDAKSLEGFTEKKKFLAGRSETDLYHSAVEYFAELRSQHLAVSKNIVAERMRQVKEYVEHNITLYDLSVTGIADSFGVNRSLLTSQFKHYHGVCLSKYIQSCRVNKAKELIAKNPDWIMERVAVSSGYISLSTMYRAFKKQVGAAPGSVASMPVDNSGTHSPPYIPPNPYHFEPF